MLPIFATIFLEVGEKSKMNYTVFGISVQIMFIKADIRERIKKIHF